MLEEFRRCVGDLNLQEFYLWLKGVGIGFTPIVRLPRRITLFDDQVSIFAKLEYTNYAESIKARPFAMMYYLNMVIGRTSNKPKAIAATSGNFGLAGSYLLRGNFDFTVNMSEKAVKENVDLTVKLQKNKTRIETFSDRYCPTVGAKRGEAIAAARYVEKIDSEVINYDQYDDAGNPLSHYLTTAPELYHQTSGRITHFVASLGTCATMIGCGHYLREIIPEIKIVGLVPQEGHHQLGLRSKDELGATRFYEEAKKLCDRIIEVSDRDAYNTMLDLWDAGIPGGISSGTNCYGALKVAEKLCDENKRGLIVILIPDSCENYGSFLQGHLYSITGIKFDGDIYKKFEKLKTKAQEERGEHTSLLNAGKNNLFETYFEKACERFNRKNISEVP